MALPLSAQIGFFCFETVPLAVPALVFRVVVRKIPSRAYRCAVPLAAGIACAVLYTILPDAGPHSDPAYMLFFLAGAAVTSALLLLPPFILAEEYLRRIPAGIALVVVVIVTVGVYLFMLDGIPGGSVLGQYRGALVTMIVVPAVSAIACTFVLGLDRVLAIMKQPEGKQPQSPAS